MMTVQKHWFTLMEMLITLVVVGVVIIGSMAMYRAAHSGVNKIRQETIAINIAREGIESVYSRRDTNWLQYPSEKDRYWLRANAYSTDRLQGGEHGTDYVWYTLEYTWANHKLINLIPNWLRLEHIHDSIKTWSTLLSWNDFMSDAIPAWGNYYRSILGQGLYLKDTSTPWGERLSCPDGENASTCWNQKAKEFRFCSKVEYDGIWAWHGNVILCGALTNYME